MNNYSGQNPLFNLPPKKDKVVSPLRDDVPPEPENPAVAFIRQKIDALYAKEPSPKEELAEVKAIRGHRSKHQQFMYDLGNSGKSLAEIQTAWHNYYTGLPDKEKHEVWQEFYANHGRASGQKSEARSLKSEESSPKQHSAAHYKKAISSDPRSLSDIKNQLLVKVSRRGRKQRPSHTRSLLFGLSMGSVTLLIMMFGFFNERFIAPFITPSRTVSSTPIIVGSSAEVSDEPRIIIPKINVDIPVVYDEPSIDEDAVQRALERGVLHYATTPNPGEKGNAVIFGHSSNNILNSGKYKFAFVLLNRLEDGDTFMLHYKGKRYVYRVYEKKVVKPTEVSVLGPTDRPATVTLITCDPPGTAINRLVVVGEQISPDPGRNVASSVKQDSRSTPAVLPSNAPSLWSRLVDWLSS